MHGERVAITGVGVLTHAGSGSAVLWDLVTTPPDGPLDGRVAREEAESAFSPKERRRHDPGVLWTLAAAASALDQAGRPEVDPRRRGVVLGVAHGNLVSLQAGFDAFREDGAAAVSPMFGSLACESTPASALAQQEGCRGPAKVVAGACASGAFALLDAAELVAAGRLDLALAGGVQGPLTAPVVAAYRNLKVHSPTGIVRPFDRRRDGFVFGEGGAVFVLERAADARARGATILAELLGGANTNDAFHPVAPSGDGARECMELALQDAGVAPEEVGHVNAHGTGTRANDAMEAQALAEVFTIVPPVTSTKWATGHAAGAAGALEAAVVVASIARGLVPPSGFGFEPDPDVALDVVHDAPRPWAAGPVLSTSFGIGGHDGALVLAPAAWTP